MKKLFPILLGLIMGLAYSTTVDAQNLNDATGKYLRFVWNDSITASQGVLFPTQGAAVSADVSDDTDTIYMNHFFTSITLEDVISGDFELTLIAGPQLTRGAQAVVSVEADQDGRAFTLAGNGVGATTAGDTLKHISLFYNGTNFLMCGESLAE